MYDLIFKQTGNLEKLSFGYFPEGQIYQKDTCIMIPFFRLNIMFLIHILECEFQYVARRVQTAYLQFMQVHIYI
jgi:hypothetical protein